MPYLEIMAVIVINLLAQLLGIISQRYDAFEGMGFWKYCPYLFSHTLELNLD